MYRVTRTLVSGCNLRTWEEPVRASSRRRPAPCWRRGRSACAAASCWPPGPRPPRWQPRRPPRWPPRSRWSSLSVYRTAAGSPAVPVPWSRIQRRGTSEAAAAVAGRARASSLMAKRGTEPLSSNASRAAKRRRPSLNASRAAERRRQTRVGPSTVVKRKSDGNRTSRSEIDRIGPRRTYWRAHTGRSRLVDPYRRSRSPIAATTPTTVTTTTGTAGPRSRLRDGRSLSHAAPDSRPVFPFPGARIVRQRSKRRIVRGVRMRRVKKKTLGCPIKTDNLLHRYVYS